MAKEGKIYRVAGPVVTAVGISPRMYDVILVGKEQLMGEVIKIVGDKTVIQVYEDTSGIAPGEKVISTGQPLVAELGPGLLGSVYDGIQRPLPVLMNVMGDFIKRGVSAPGLDHKAKWPFTPIVKKGDKVVSGQIIGTVPERSIVHKVMVPPGVSGTVEDIKQGEFTVDDTVAVIGGKSVQMMQKWPVRIGRPFTQEAGPGPAPGHRAKDPGHLVPDNQGRYRRHPRRFRYRKDRHPAAAGQMVRRRDRRLHRLRRARQRDDRGAHHLPRAGGPQDRQTPHGQDRAHCQHLQHAGGGS